MFFLKLSNSKSVAIPDDDIVGMDQMVRLFIAPRSSDGIGLRKEYIGIGLLLHPNIKLRVIYTGTKLSSHFSNVNDFTSFEEQHDVVYHSFYSSENYNYNYISKSGWDLNEKIKRSWWLRS